MAGKRVLRRSGVGAEHSPGASNPIPAPIEKWAQARPVRPGAQIKEMSGIAADRQQPRSSGSGTVFRLCSRPVKVAQPIDGEASPALDRRLARLHLADRDGGRQHDMMPVERAIGRSARVGPVVLHCRAERLFG